MAAKQRVHERQERAGRIDESIGASQRKLLRKRQQNERIESHVLHKQIGD